MDEADTAAQKLDTVRSNAVKHLIRHHLLGDLFPSHSDGTSDGFEAPANEDGLKWCFGLTSSYEMGLLASSGASSATSPVVNINENNALNAVIFDSDAYRYRSDTAQHPKDTNIIYTFADTNQQ